jgi:ABC-type ATPase involved in cell division
MATHDLELIRRADCRTVEVNRGQLVFDTANGAGGGTA